MAEYFDWVNIDKKEYIEPCAFDEGPRFRNSAYKDSKTLGALQTLLANEWKDDHIIWIGDQTLLINDTTNVTIKNLYNQTTNYGTLGCQNDIIFDTYKDISVYFKDTKDNTQEELENIIEHYYDDYVSDYYKIDINDPYKGLYERTIKWYRYMINHTKKIYYDVENIIIIEKDAENQEFVNDYNTPLPFLMGYGYYGIGEWLGDIVGVSDEIPEGYELIDRIYFG